MSTINRPQNHLSKQEAAARLGVCTRTLDRRRAIEGALPRVLKAGRNLWFPERDVESYVKLTRERGYV
ncbi:MAG: hypothetical protein ACTS3F_09150 [Phycisphaerales bacterium]